MNFKKNKKAIQLTSSKILGLIILAFVIFFASTGVLNFKDNTKNQLSSVNIASELGNCEIGICQITNCEPIVNSDCTDNEKSKWESLKNYANTCKNKDGSQCNNALIDAIKKAKKVSNTENNGNSNEVNTKLISKDEILNFKKSDFYKKYHKKFEDYSKEKNIDENILYSILINEGSYSNSFEKNVRFECHKFNKAISFQKSKVPCTLKNGESFSRINSQTNYEAYLRAKKIDSQSAFRSTSFGFGQIMGFNIMGYGIPIDVNGDLNEIKNMENQILFFFKFLENNGIIKEIQNKNWNNIAIKYNGVKYAQNNYNNKLKNNYEILIS